MAGCKNRPLFFLTSHSPKMKRTLLLLLLLSISARADQILTNGGFENDELGAPDGWVSKVGFGTQSLSLSKDAPNEGTVHLVLSVTTDNGDKNDGGPGTGPGRIAVEQLTPESSITPGTAYIFSFFSTTPDGFFTTVSPRYQLEWLDESNLPVGSTELTGFAGSVGKDGFYEEFSMELTAPAEADRVRIFFDLEGGSLNNPNDRESVLYLDHVSLKPSTAGSPH